MKAKSMVDAIELAMSKNIGIKQVTADGETVTFASIEEMQASLNYWIKKANAEAGRRPLFRGYNMSGAWSGSTEDNG